MLKLGSSRISAKTDRLNIEGGMLEVSWGSADSLGPLDVVNPRDYSDQTDPDFLSRKVAQPMLYGSYAIDHVSRVEAVFVPESTAKQFSSGLRFTTSVGASDVGLQFYYGSLPKAGTVVASPANPNEVPVRAGHNRYSQLGADLSSAIGATTVRGEIAADITDDLSGTDGSVCNPSVLWSLGSERVLSGGLELNAQCSGSVRLMSDKVGTEKNDIESDSAPSDTTLALRLSRKFLEDRLLVSATTLYGIESSACLVKSAIAWGPASRRIELSGGVFSGSPASSLVRFLDHDYVKLTLSCDY